ncbi:hypothetical protein EST62_05710 [Chlorobaculum sp. 24CR]|uniref:hypothetical protein n=1 Tax=Chlorobaculum sp. 24CR TaxID=2508878 RepID=UPI00100B31AC|nr:hypothetical protein [Chlorobaculum sp. 24CR]RXK87836.1 hypothetical protein EST62_05710 [Chlorobaculum sp. 24CR]
MDFSADKPRPSSIHVEWRENGDFVFSCRYLTVAERSAVSREQSPPKRHFFPTMTLAMGNVLRKLRREHISFPLFLVSLAFNHRNLLSEIDRLLQALHNHVDQQKGSGEYTCLVTSREDQS